MVFTKDWKYYVKYTLVMASNSSWPAVSQSMSRTSSPLALENKNEHQYKFKTTMICVNKELNLKFEV